MARVASRARRRALTESVCICGRRGAVVLRAGLITAQIRGALSTWFSNTSPPGAPPVGRAPGRSAELHGPTCMSGSPGPLSPVELGAGPRSAIGPRGLLSTSRGPLEAPFGAPLAALGPFSGGGLQTGGLDASPRGGARAGVAGAATTPQPKVGWGRTAPEDWRSLVGAPPAGDAVGRRTVVKTHTASSSARRRPRRGRPRSPAWATQGVAGGEGCRWEGTGLRARDADGA
eukprot:scaffold104_cov375-Prasinococcus_capsulatus_cf.AAC.6